MYIVNIRHPGYDDAVNILFTLQAPDDPNGGLHAETARLACCAVAGNRWDGYLSIVQNDPTPVVTEDGILRRKDYYFHLPRDKAERQLDGAVALVDRREDREEGPYAITARFADWSFPKHGLPELWTLTGESVRRQAAAAKSGENAPLLDGRPALRGRMPVVRR
jgi:hypothetical protein